MLQRLLRIVLMQPESATCLETTHAGERRFLLSEDVKPYGMTAGFCLEVEQAIEVMGLIVSYGGAVRVRYAHAS